MDVSCSRFTPRDNRPPSGVKNEKPSAEFPRRASVNNFTPPCRNAAVITCYYKVKQVGAARDVPAPFVPQKWGSSRKSGEVCNPAPEEGSRYQSVVGLKGRGPRTRQGGEAASTEDGVFRLILDFLDLIELGQSLFKEIGDIVESGFVLDRNKDFLAVLFRNFKDN